MVPPLAVAANLHKYGLTVNAAGELHASNATLGSKLSVAVCHKLHKVLKFRYAPATTHIKTCYIVIVVARDTAVANILTIEFVIADAVLRLCTCIAPGVCVSIPHSRCPSYA